MHVDIYKRTVTVTREELRNHQIYLKVKEWTDKRYELVIPDPPRPDLRNAVVLTREEARNHQTFKAAQAKAEQERKFLWVEE